MPEKYRSGIYRSEEKIFPLLLRPCKSKGCQKSSLSQEQGSSWCAKGVVHLSCWVFSQKKGRFYCWREKSDCFFLWASENVVFRAHKIKTHFSSSSGNGPLFLLNTQQHRWTTLAHQELPCSCDKLDFWQPLLLHGRSNYSGNIFSLDL